MIFLDKMTLAYKDNAYIGPEFEIVIDKVLIQRSTFKLNKINIMAKIGDIVVVQDKLFSYIGILEGIEKTDDKEIKINTFDFREMFNLEIPVFSYKGDLAQYLYNLIHENFINNPDSLQNLKYLTIIKEVFINGELNFENNKIESLAKLFELIAKEYKIRFIFEVSFLRGRIVGIIFRIVAVNQGVIIKSNFSAILNVEINNSSSQQVNKVIFYPRSDNQNYLQVKKYYLLTNGTITNDVTAEKRYENVKTKSFVYGDNDYESLETKAKSIMIASKLDHSITFLLDTNNKIFKPFYNLKLGDYVSFIHDNKTYESIITGMKFKNTMRYVLITLGEYRIKLTEKIQLLSMGSDKRVSNVEVMNKNIDGGEF